MTITVKASRVFGSTDDFYGDVIVHNDVEIASEIAEICPYTYEWPDVSSMHHMGFVGSSRDYPNKYVAFNENYHILSVGTNLGTGLQKDNHFGDKNYLITQYWIFDFLNNTVISNAITDITKAVLLLNNGKILCYKYTSPNYVYTEGDPFTGEKDTPLGAIQTTTTNIYPTSYFQSGDYQYLLRNSNTSQSYERCDGLDSAYNIVVWNKGGTYDLYVAMGMLWGYTFYSGYNAIENPRNYYKYLVNPLDVNDYYYFSSLNDYRYLCELKGSDKTILVYDNTSLSLYKIKFDSSHNNVTFLQTGTGGRVINFENKTLYRDNSGVLYDITNNSVLSSSFPSFYYAYGDTKNNWIWMVEGNDMCAYELNGTLAYKIENVSNDTNEPKVAVYRNKFVFKDKIVCWEWED